MALNWAETELRRTGDPRDAERADIIASIHKGRGEDIPLPQEAGRLRVPSAREIQITKPPQELLDTLSRARELGITSLEAHYLPEVELKEGDKYPGWKVKPESWFWQQIGKNVAKDAVKLPGVWVLIDNAPKPNYENGAQMYSNDPFGSTLARLRQEGKIAKASVLDTSRFNISWDEIDNYVNPAIAELLGVRKDQVRLPREIEFNILGNMHHREWGETSTWEWFEDIFEGGDRLVGGRSDDGGLAGVNCGWSGLRNDRVGFRPLVVFS